MKTTRLFICIMLLVSITCVGCNSRRTAVQKTLRYDNATVIYPKEDGPWTAYHFFSINPEIFIELYDGALKTMVIRDTAFLNKLVESIESRAVIYKADTCKRSFDTFFIVKLNHNVVQSPDTLALGNNLLRFNQEVYEDSNTIRMITDKIIKHDKDFAEDVKEYYVDGVWYPYVGKGLFGQHPSCEE